MSGIKVKEEKIKDKTGVWYLAADILKKMELKIQVEINMF